MRLRRRVRREDGRAKRDLDANPADALLRRLFLDEGM
jgi:hypothetical protein